MRENLQPVLCYLGTSPVDFAWEKFQKPLHFVQRGRILLRCGSALALSLPSLGVSSLDLGRLFTQAALFSCLRHSPTCSCTSVDAPLGAGPGANHDGEYGLRSRPGMTKALFCRCLEWSELAERNGGQRVGQRGEIRHHLREPRAAFAPPLVHVYGTVDFEMGGM